MSDIKFWQKLPRTAGSHLWLTSPYLRAHRNAASRTRLSIDVFHSADAYTVEASLPGFTAEEIEVTVGDGTLQISATTSTEESQEEGKYLVRERAFGKFYRAIKLPKGIDVDGATSTYENGVLKIRLPKSETDHPKRLQIGS